ncbi:unnamed protein product [Knipowitschia caucasica]
MSVDFRVWVAAVKDPCILGLDFLRAAHCVLDLGSNTVTFPGSPSVEMVPPEHVQSQAASKAAEVHQKYVPLPQFFCSSTHQPATCNGSSTSCTGTVTCSERNGQGRGRKRDLGT